MKQMFADLSPENRALKDVIEKNSEACCKTGTGQLRGADICSQHQAGLPGFFFEPDGLSLPSRHVAR